MTRRPRARRTHDSAALGRYGEDAAAALLRASGFKIVARNLRTRLAEIDLLVRKGPLLAAVEVKTRTGHGAPEWTLQSRQLARLRRALTALAFTQRSRPRVLRVDVVAVRPPVADTDLEILHFEGHEFPAAAANS